MLNKATKFEFSLSQCVISSPVWPVWLTNWQMSMLFTRPSGVCDVFTSPHPPNNLGYALDLASSFPVNNPGKLSVPYRHREQDKSIRRNPYCFVSSFFDPFLTAAEERWFRMTIATFLFRKTKKRRRLQHPCITHRGVIDRRSLSVIRAWPRGLGMCRLLWVRLVISLGCVELRVSEVIDVFG